MIRVPRLGEASALGQIVDRRVSIQIEGAGGGDAVEEPALERLFHYYNSVWHHSLRLTLQALHLALSSAVAAKAEMISAAAIDDAAAALQ